MIRRFLAREVQRLLQEFDAPDIRTLWHRICFWAYFYISCSILLGGLVALYSLFGLAAMWLGVVAIYLLHIWLLRRTPVYCGDGSEFGLDLGGSAPILPPGKPQLPPSGTPQIGRASTALTPSRPGPVAHR
jgi:hypothetical protein